ncbi:outer membrane lipoprotein-sorting protein [Prosthecochloris sp. SCSIO W1101]|uniref:outer membrane lipoprotein-sorting protein n=1 Tax=Prosthecochloris sp. SCSIO W1101 TaxID=2992242 RepID=UPI00223E72B8|nr:outer membrane lipoprotein-sorting protein [Prosthecochloris sp. SCSIO W1101]UZJ40689.1 outer membrane lipoprotein-sorting protein [Prosthecochloris sp. SCSIO W1101]
MIRSTIILMFTIFLSAGLVHAEPTGRDIMLKSDDVDNSRDAVMSSMMVIERGSSKLIRRMESRTKQYGENLKDERTLIRFVEPADVHDTAYLTWSYDDPEREDDMWVYLPAESLVRRISGGGKKGAFMRSDLANEDIEDRAVDDDEHTLTGEEDVSGIACYVVESVPRPELKKDTNYSKRVQFIRKDLYLPARIDYYDKRGKLLKTATFGGYKQIDGIWTVTRFLYETPRRKTRTLFQRSNISYNQGLDDALFLQNNLMR